MWGRTKIITSPAVDVRAITALPSGSSDGYLLPNAGGDVFDRYWLLIGFNGGSTPTVDLIPYVFDPNLPSSPIDMRWCSLTKISGIDTVGAVGQLVELPQIPPSSTRIYLRATDVSDSTASHDYPDAANSITSANATDLTSGIALGNEAKAKYNAHDVDTGTVFHFAAGSNHQVTAADAATLEAELVALCQDIQTQYAAHLADAIIHSPADAVNTTAAVAIADTATCISFLNDLKAKYNAHRIFSAPANVYALLVAAEETK